MRWLLCVQMHTCTPLVLCAILCIHVGVCLCVRSPLYMLLRAYVYYVLLVCVCVSTSVSVCVYECAAVYSVCFYVMIGLRYGELVRESKTDLIRSKHNSSNISTSYRDFDHFK